MKDETVITDELKVDSIQNYSIEKSSFMWNFIAFIPFLLKSYHLTIPSLHHQLLHQLFFT